jgi:hypothetical protein
MSRLKPQLPVVETLPVAEPIELVRELLSCRFLEERVERLSDEGFRIDAQKPARDDIRIADCAVQIGGEIRLGGEVEQLAILDPLFHESITAAGERLAPESKLLVGEAKFFDRCEQFIAIAAFSRRVRELHVDQLVRTQLRIG